MQKKNSRLCGKYHKIENEKERQVAKDHCQLTYKTRGLARGKYNSKTRLICANNFP